MKKNNDNQDKQAKNASGEKKHSSALAAAQAGRSATDKVKARSSSDVNGASGTRNTGTNVSYEDKE